MRRLHAILADAVGIEHRLGNPPFVPDIYEYQSPQVAMPVDPAANGHLLPDVSVAKLAAGVRSQTGLEYIIAVRFQ